MFRVCSANELMTHGSISFSIIVVLICVEEYMLRKVMLAAHAQGMTNGEYVFIYPNLLPSNNWDRLWQDETATNDENSVAFEAFRPLIQVRCALRHLFIKREALKELNVFHIIFSRK